MTAHNNSLYIASFPANDIANEDNVIYKIENVNSPKVEKVTNKFGMFDGIAIDGDNLYYTDWTNMEIDCLNLKSNKITRLNIPNEKITGPADICILNHTIFLPNLPSSEIIEIPLK